MGLIIPNISDNPKIRVLPTYYKGVTFRSKTEAHWAVCFDHLGLEWVYEPEGFELKGSCWYMPDFYFPQIDAFAEVKPKDHFGEMKKAIALCKYSKKPVFFLDGWPDNRQYRLFYVKDGRTKKYKDFFDYILMFFIPQLEDHWKKEQIDQLGNSICFYKAIYASRSYEFEKLRKSKNMQRSAGGKIPSNEFKDWV